MIKELEPLANFVLNKTEEESDEEVVIYQRILPSGKSKITNLDVKRAREAWNSGELSLKINDKEGKNITPFGKITIIGSELVNRRFEHEIGYLAIKESKLQRCVFCNALHNCELSLNTLENCCFRRNCLMVDCCINGVVFVHGLFYNEFRNSIIKDCIFNDCSFLNSKIDGFCCNLNACDFENCVFVNCIFSLPTTTSDFKACSFEGCCGSLETNHKLV